jgi:hypothetical protein
MRRSIPLTLTLAAVSVVSLVSVAPAAARTVRVSTWLTWQPHRATPTFASDIRLSITRNGKHRLARARVVRGSSWMVPREPHRSVPVHVVDLAGRGEPNVLVDLYTGGAYCCNEVRIYRWTGHRYVRSPLYDFGESGYRLRRLGHGRSVELVSAFPAYAVLDVTHLDSGYPVQAWRFVHGRLRNVTRRYPALLRRDARAWREEEARRRASGLPSVGMLAAYVVDLQRAGERTAADAALDAAALDGELDTYTPASFRAAVAQLRRALDAKHPPTGFN